MQIKLPFPVGDTGSLKFGDRALTPCPPQPHGLWFAEMNMRISRMAPLGWHLLHEISSYPHVYPRVPKYTHTHMCTTGLRKPEAWTFAVENAMTGCSGPALPYHGGQSAFLSVSHGAIYPSLHLQILSAKYQGRKNTHVSHQFTSSLYLGWNQEATSSWPNP